jgi:hypothetical protein
MRLLVLNKQPDFLSSLTVLRFVVAKNDDKLAGPLWNHKVFLQLF